MSLQHECCYDTCSFLLLLLKSLQYLLSPSLKLMLNLLFITFMLFDFFSWKMLYQKM